MMKNKVMTLLALTTLASPSFAFDSSRISGELILGTGYKSTNSNLSVEGNSRSNGLDSKGSHTNEVIVMPLGLIAYDLTEQRNQRVYLGTSRDDLAVGDLAFEIGYQYNFMNGTTIDVAFLPTIMSGEVWADPYKTDGPRKKEDVEGYAYRLKLNNLMNSGISLDMAYATKEVDNEAIIDESLHRDADVYYAKASYYSAITTNSGFLTSVSYKHNDADGKAETFDEYTAEFTYSLIGDVHSLALTGSYGYRNYDSASVTFNKKRSDDQYGVFLAYEYADFAGWDNWSLISLSGVDINKSNIKFYESEDYLVTVGMSYKF